MGGDCMVVDQSTIELYSDETYNTAADSDAMVCGYFAEYEWTGEGAMQFDIYSNQAKMITEAVGLFVLMAIGTNLL
jgi:hypothetical protein